MNLHIFNEQDWLAFDNGAQESQYEPPLIASSENVCVVIDRTGVDVNLLRPDGAVDLLTTELNYNIAKDLFGGIELKNVTLQWLLDRGFEIVGEL